MADGRFRFLGARSWAVALGAFLAFTATARVSADGTEILGPPVGLEIADGSDVLIAGVGLVEAQPDDIELDVPAGVDVRQAILYWEGFDANELDHGATDTILLNGAPLEGARIGGPTLFFAGAWVSTYRADITSLGLVSAGATNTLSISGLDFTRANNGAGLLVVVDDGVGTTAIDLRDGSDAAFFRFKGPLTTTVPQTFTFEAASIDRVANIDMFFASIALEDPDGNVGRPTVVEISIDGMVVERLVDVLDNSDGHEWDSFSHDVTIPAGATSLTIQALSEDDGTGPYAGHLQASLVWVAAAFTLAPEPPAVGEIGDFVWCDKDDDGVQDPGEPGIPGVTVLLVCAGPDEMIGTDDDIVDMTMTDEDGLYLFEDLPAGECRVAVDESTLPEGKIRSKCPPEITHVLGAGESFLDADFCYIERPEDKSEGCTPGYWKQPHHFDDWAEPYTPDTLFGDVFADAFPGKTLLDVVSEGGGGLNALGRHAVAALLNAASNEVGYGITPQDVIDAFNHVFLNGTSGDAEDLKDVFEELNERGCPLGRGDRPDDKEKCRKGKYDKKSDKCRKERDKKSDKCRKERDKKDDKCRKDKYEKQDDRCDKGRDDKSKGKSEKKDEKKSDKGKSEKKDEKKSDAGKSEKKAKK